MAPLKILVCLLCLESVFQGVFSTSEQTTYDPQTYGSGVGQASQGLEAGASGEQPPASQGAQGEFGSGESAAASAPGAEIHSAEQKLRNNKQRPGKSKGHRMSCKKLVKEVVKYCVRLDKLPTCETPNHCKSQARCLGKFFKRPELNHKMTSLEFAEVVQDLCSVMHINSEQVYFK